MILSTILPSRRNQEAFRQSGDAAVLVADRFFSDQDGIVHAHILGEFADVFLAGVIHGDADDLQSLRAVLFLQVDEPGHFDFAGAAPGRPEVEQHGLAAKVGEAQWSCRRATRKRNRERLDWVSRGPTTPRLAAPGDSRSKASAQPRTPPLPELEDYVSRQLLQDV